MESAEQHKMGGSMTVQIPVAVLAAVILRILLSLALWEPGWSALTWDDFTRVLLAQTWSEDPFLAVDDLVWLPLQTWVYGTAFFLTGDLFAENPMVLAAVLNTAAAIATAGLIGWAAWVLFRSRAGAVLAFVVVLFSPWVTFASLSGLNESFYYLAVAGAVAGLTGRLCTGSMRALVLGAAAVGAATLLRYDGWTLAVAWVAVVAVDEMGWLPRLTGAEQAADGTVRAPLRQRWHVLAIAVAPLAIPASYVLLNLVRTGDPLHFAAESTRYFSAAFGSVGGPLTRITYYPGALVRSAPLLLPVLVALVAVTARRHRVVRLLAGFVALHLVLFAAPSLVSQAVGAFAERFMFAFVLALTPLLGAVPELLRRLRRPVAVAAAVALAMAGVGAGWVRTADAPESWTHAPDLLELADVLGKATSGAEPLTVALGPGLTYERIPLGVRNGDRVAIARTPGVRDPADVPHGIDLWVERLPNRVRRIETAPGAVIGRYHLYGPAAATLDIETADCGCAGWVYRDEQGRERPVPLGPYMALEFVGDDPAAGAQAVLSRTYASDEAGPHRHRIRSLYGHGFNLGRLRVEVRVDGEVVRSWDVGERSRWIDVDYVIPDAGAVVAIAVVARPGIETGWEWGRASTVLVTGPERSR